MCLYPKFIQQEALLAFQNRSVIILKCSVIQITMYQLAIIGTCIINQTDQDFLFVVYILFMFISKQTVIVTFGVAHVFYMTKTSTMVFENIENTILTQILC